MLGQGVDTVLVKRGTSGSLQVSKDAGPLLQSIFPVEKVCPSRITALPLLPHDRILASTRYCHSGPVQSRSTVRRLWTQLERVIALLAHMLWQLWKGREHPKR